MGVSLTLIRLCGASWFSKERSLIVIEHDIDFIESLLCSVKVLNEGTVLAEGTMADLKKNKEVIEVYLGR